MSKQIYACLLGNWVCLNDDLDCKMGNRMISPYMWWEENAEIYYPINRTEEQEHSLYNMPYVNIFYLHHHYRISPIFIQILDD